MTYFKKLINMYDYKIGEGTYHVYYWTDEVRPRKVFLTFNNEMEAKDEGLRIKKEEGKRVWFVKRIRTEHSNKNTEKEL